MDDAELVSILSQTEKNSLAILLQVVNTCQQEAMAQPPVPGSAMRLLKAQEALEKLKRLQASGSASSDAPAPSLGKLPAVEKYLSAAGWKVKKSKLYQDKKKGLLKVQPDGTVLKLDADTYAAGNLAPADAAPDADDQETLKLKRELLRVDLETKRQLQERSLMRLQAERGDLVSREELDNILVSFVTVLRASLRQFFYMLTPQLVEIVRGDPSRIEEAIHFELEKSNEFWNGFAKARNFDVVDEDEDAEPVPQPDNEDVA